MYSFQVLTSAEGVLPNACDALVDGYRGKGGVVFKRPGVDGHHVKAFDHAQDVQAVAQFELVASADGIGLLHLRPRVDHTANGDRRVDGMAPQRGQQ